MARKSRTSSRASSKAPARAPKSAAQAPGFQSVPKHRWLFRLILLFGAPLLGLLALEVGLRLAGFGYRISFFLPATIDGKSMRIENDRFTWRFLGREMARQPFPVVLPAAKDPGTIRIFVLGESAAYGDPQPEFGLPRMLQALLEGRYAGTHFEVVNAAITAINSHVLLPLARDCAGENGDAWVIYMGNNEVVGPFGAGTVFGSPGASLALIRASLVLKELRSGQLFESLFSALGNQPYVTREWGGMAMFMQHELRAEDPRMQSVYAHFAHNLREMLRAGQSRGVKLAVGTVASNLKDCAPFASLHRTGLTPGELTEWDLKFQQGLAALQSGQSAGAAELFQEASRIDDSYADLQFVWGQACVALGKPGEALDHLTRARDEDGLRFRTDTRLNQIIRQVAADRESEGIGLVDTERTLAAQSPQGLPGDEMFYEHVHLKFEGNYQIAKAFAEELSKLLPALSALQTNSLRDWPSASDCATRLGFTDWHRYQAQSEMLGRIADAPFVGQINHRQEYEKTLALLQTLQPGASLTGLRQAEEECQKAAARFPDDWILNKDLALVRERRGDHAGAADCWKRVVNALPQYAEAWEQLGRRLAEQKSDENAVAAFRRTLALERDAPGALTGMAEIYSREGRQEEARVCYERILKQKPYWSSAQWGLGQVLEALGKTNEAQPHFHQALQNRIHTPAALKGLGSLCFDKGWFIEAATNFVDALKMDPLDAATEVNLGLTQALLGHHPDAQIHYAAALRIDPNFPEAHVRLGFELGRQGNDAAALEHFAKAVELKPELIEARLDLGIALSNQHRQSEALEQFQEVLRRSPTNAVALGFVRRLEQRSQPPMNTDKHG